MQFEIISHAGSAAASDGSAGCSADESLWCRQKNWMDSHEI